MSPTTVARLVRAAVVSCLLLLNPVTPALAAGTGGIEVTPIPGVVDGEQVTAFDVEVTGERQSVAYALRNVTSSPKSARLYAASATRQADGGFSVGGPGSSPLVTLDDEDVTLAPGAFERRSFSVQGNVQKTTFAAVVVEVRNGSVVTRAATLIYLKPTADLPIPLLLGLGAAAAALAAGTGVVVVGRRRRAEPDQGADPRTELDRLH